MAPGRARIVFVTGVIVLIVSCGRDSGLKSLENFELAERQASCLDRAPTAPGSVQACKNIAKECERRKEDLGVYACRSQ